uniref:Small ribosomal subunit protein mS31 n=1 Tax=Cyclopterus lumpus TaxID=8103 RepID=A0A8C2WY43_CYCLU
TPKQVKTNFVPVHLLLTLHLNLERMSEAPSVFIHCVFFRETLDPKLVEAASAAASTLPDRSQAESELLRQLMAARDITEAQKKGDVNNLGVIIADMKVGKNPNRQNARPANQIRFDDDGRGYTHDRGITAELDRRNLFSGKRLNIFSPTTDEAGVDLTLARPTLWDMDFANQLSLSTNQTPRNGLEEMIQWTKEGKIMLYFKEASVPFHEHIFLEETLGGGFCPQYKTTKAWLLDHLIL